MDALRCDRCKVKFESRDQLAMHMLDHSYTPEEEAMSANNEERSKLTAAELLDMRKRGLMANMTNSLHELMSANMQDLIAGYTNSESKCEICFKVFADRDTLAMHTLSHAHEQKTYQKPGRAESYSCMYCGMVFSYEDMLLLHVVSRHKQLNGKVPLDLSLKSSLSQKRSHEVMSHRLPSHVNLLRTRSSEATPLTTNPPHPSTVLAAAMMSFQSSTYAACGSTSDERPPSKRPRTSSTSSLPIAISPKCKTEPLTPPASDPDEKQTRSSSASSQPSTSASTPSPLNQLHTKQSSQSLDKPSPDSCTSVDSTTRRSTPSEAPSNSDKSSSKNEAGGAMNPIQALQRALGDSKEMFYFCIHCNIIFLDRAMYHLHTGLHNRNSPFQCNICGKEYSNPLEFSAHIIHT